MACGAVFVIVVLVFFLGPRRGPSQHGLKWMSSSSLGRPMILSHGDCPCLPEPANSMQWFRYASSVGVDALELDLVLTKDDALIAFHDRVWDHKTNSTGLVRETTYAEVRDRIDVSKGWPTYRGNGTRVVPPLLDDVLGNFSSSHLAFNMELKNDPADAALAARVLCATLERHGVANRTLVASFDTESVEAVRAECGSEVATSASLSEGYGVLVPMILELDRWWFSPGPISVLNLPRTAAGFDLTTKRIINAAHAHGMPTIYFTINEKDQLDTLIANGADGIITDEPLEARLALQRAGLELPPTFVPSGGG